MKYTILLLIIFACKKPEIQEDGTLFTMEEKVAACENYLKQADEDLANCRAGYFALCDLQFEERHNQVMCYNWCDCGAGHFGIGTER